MLRVLETGHGELGGMHVCADILLNSPRDTCCFVGKDSMRFVYCRSSPATPATVLIIISIWFLSLVGCGGGSTPISPPPAKDFSLVLSPSTITADPGSSNSTFTVSATGKNGFTDSVAI